MDLKEFLSSIKSKAPTINIQGGQKVNPIPIRLPEGTVNAREEINRASGDIGLNFEAPSMVQGMPTSFGFGASGQYMLGQVDFPEEVQKYGAPETMKIGRGLTIDQLQAYLNTPITENLDLDVNARINPYYVDPVDGRMLGKDKFVGANLRYSF
jgi:hypothetical protein|tara:strand:- start:2154 stop:2615 length:462 start_codon:yes stop_codon:yes gene_type:complete